MIECQACGGMRIAGDHRPLIDITLRIDGSVRLRCNNCRHTIILKGEVANNEH